MRSVADGDGACSDGEMESEIRVVFHETVDAVRPLLAERALRQRLEAEPAAGRPVGSGARRVEGHPA